MQAKMFEDHEFALEFNLHKNFVMHLILWWRALRHRKVNDLA